MKRIGMLTSGGDCQALNAAMRGVVKSITTCTKDVEIYGFLDGYRGLIYSNFRMLTSADFSGILTEGGTILGTSRTPFKTIQRRGCRSHVFRLGKRSGGYKISDLVYPRKPGDLSFRIGYVGAGL